jgi:tetraacyldisaccharide 4'-kinase
MPVVCVGNAVVGGGGKTPVARAVRAWFMTRGVRAATLSRGHGGRLYGPVQVDAARHDAGAVGDEPLMLSADGPAFIARDRVAGARAAAEAGVKVLVMDDGHQNPSLHKDLSILVFDAGRGIGNGQVIPAGPLREPVDAALARADAVIAVHARLPEPDSLWSTRGGRPDWLSAWRGPVLDLHYVPLDLPPPGPVVAFAGLARPEKVHETLRGAGVELVDLVPFPDHHVWRESDLQEMDRLARAHGARLLTTEKDAARLPAAWRPRVHVLRIEARPCDPAALDALLAPVLAPGLARQGDGQGHRVPAALIADA